MYVIAMYKFSVEDILGTIVHEDEEGEWFCAGDPVMNADVALNEFADSISLEGAAVASRIFVRLFSVVDGLFKDFSKGFTAGVREQGIFVVECFEEKGYGREAGLFVVSDNHVFKGFDNLIMREISDGEKIFFGRPLFLW